MPYRKMVFEKGKTFHILARAIEERKIFEREEDCYRFIFQIYAANVGKPAFKLWQKDVIKVAKSLLEGEDISSKFVIKEHPPLVHILDFSLVINHYHFYLISNIENGVPIFVKKLNGGFAMYFNLKHGRKGALFGSRYKGILVESEFQSDAVSCYVSIINPLDVFQPGWRETGLQDSGEALKFLENYQFSSFPDKIGKRKAKILAPPEISKIYSLSYNVKKEEYLQFVKDFLGKKLSSIQPLFLE